MDSCTDYSALIRKKQAAHPVCTATATYKATEFQFSPQYTPTENEIAFVKAVYAAENSGAIPQEVADQVQMIQFRKVSGARLMAPPDAVHFLRNLARRHGVKPEF